MTHTSTTESGSPGAALILDETDSRARRFQLLAGVGIVVSFIALIGGIVGILPPIASTFGTALFGSSFLAALLVRQLWQVGYRGHAIRYQNHLLSGGCLFIDGTAVAKGRLGRRQRLEARIQQGQGIQHGQGIGDTVIADCHAEGTTFPCRLLVTATEPQP